MSSLAPDTDAERALGHRAARAISTVALACALVALARSAAAEPPRVALIEVPDNVQRAAITALAPWQIDVVVGGGAPAGDPGAWLRDAHTLSLAHGAAAVVWIAVGDGGAALWLYDRDSGQLTSRPLSAPPPFDEPTAAAVALSIKTLLRNSDVAPIGERIGRPGRDSRAWFVEVAALARVQRDPDRAVTDVEPRLALTGVWMPGAGRLGVSVGGRVGPGVRVEDPEFIGNFKDVEISAGGRIRLPLARRVAWMGELAGQLHITSIEGDLQTAGRRGRADRVNTSVSVAGYLRWRLTSRFHADVAVRGAMALRRQRYLVADEPVFSLPLATLEAALGIVIAL